MGNIPNTTTSGLVLQSVGNGSNDSQWAINSSAGSVTLAGDVTGASGSNTVIKINGSPLGTTTGATDGYVLTWNATSSTWVPAVSGNSIAGYPVNVTGLGNGDVLYWSNVGAVQQWVTGPTPTGDGQLQYWNTSLSGHWSLSAAATSTGQALVWNNSTLTWGPAAVPLVGDVSGTTASNQVVSLASGQTLALTGANFPVSGSIMQYSTSTSSWTTGAAPTQNGQILEWNGFGWAQSDSTAPSNGNTLIWNSSIAPTGKWTPGNITLAGDVTGSTGANTVIKIQNYPVNVTGLTGSGSFMYYSSIGSQFSFSGTPSTTGSIMYWNGSSYVSTTPSGTGVLQWNSGSSTYSYVSVGGSTPNNDAWSANPQSTAVLIGTSPVTINSVSFNTGTFGFSKFLVTFSMGQSGAQSAAATLTVNIIEGSGSALVANFAVGQALTTTRNTYSGSLVYVPLTPVSIPSTMTLQCYWNTGSSSINFSTLSVVGIQ